MERRLAAILAADVEGYSRLMEMDEQATLAALKACRAELIDPKIRQYNGRLVKLMGDGALVEFGSAADAVRCAFDIQSAMAERDTAVGSGQSLAFRIGINLGDIIVEGGDIYGDGVNVAARLEAAAEAGGICISGSVYDVVASKLAMSFDDLGEHTVKNITRPIRIYRVRLDAGAPSAADRSGGSAPVPPDRPSIAALPFVNMSRDPEQEYFADGMTEDIITDLSKVGGLFVIARNSTFTYKGKAVHPQRVSRDLGARYVLEGSVRKVGSRVRINAQLIDGQTGGHVWADRFDRDLEDIFTVQDEVTEKIVSALRITLTHREREQLKRQDTANLEAYDCVLRGKEGFMRFTREGNGHARRMYERAIALDPGYALAHAELARVNVQARNHGWIPSLSEALDQAHALALKALALDRTLAQGHVVLGFVEVWRKEHEAAAREIGIGLALDPNHADGHMYHAVALSFAGRPEEAIDWVERAVRLNPASPFWYHWARGNACYALKRYGDAVEACAKASREKPLFVFARLCAAASLAALDRPEEARAELEAARGIVPALDVAWAREVLPFRQPDMLERCLSDLKNAGLPDA